MAHDEDNTYKRTHPGKRSRLALYWKIGREREGGGEELGVYWGGRVLEGLRVLKGEPAEDESKGEGERRVKGEALKGFFQEFRKGRNITFPYLYLSSHMLLLLLLGYPTEMAATARAPV